MFSFDTDLDIDSSVELMKNSITDTQYGEISISERSAKFDDLSVLEGEFIGFLNGKLLSSEKSIAKVWLKRGSGNIHVNGKKMSEYFKKANFVSFYAQRD